jgi:hypothetical protein
MTLPMIDRRSLIASGGALALGGCAHCTFPPVSQAAERIGDAHAHFFNLADLPVAGFVKFVLIPRHFPDLPEFTHALVDIIAYIAKHATLTADEEARQLGAGTLGSAGAQSSRDFARAAAKAHRIGLGGKAPVDNIDQIGEGKGAPGLRADLRASSHRALAALLGGSAPGKGATRKALDESDFEAIAAGGSLRSAKDPDLQCPPPASLAQIPDRLPSVRNLLYWAYLMCRARCYHVEEYLRTIQRVGASVADAINLLVDYDCWLDDRPSKGSEQAQQIAYWTRYSAASASIPGRIRLHSFVGFDPLRDAEERVLEHAAVTSFAAMKDWAIEGRDPASSAPRKIQGFKVYPPMGFRPDNNSVIDIPNARGGKAIKARWDKVNSFSRIGSEIDSSLDSFFRFCVEQDIPVMTHARESNIALEGHGGDPSPRHWLTRVTELAERFPAPQYKPLRLCLGHFDMFSCPGPKDDRQVLLEALALNKAGKARVYFDLSFDDRILANDGKALFTELADVCRQAGDDGDYIMFGSDWIMLANQPNVGEYVQLAYEAAKSVRFWEDKLDKLFGGNLRRFLDPASN